MSLRVTQIVVEVVRTTAKDNGIPVVASTTLAFAGTVGATNPVKHISAASSIAFAAIPLNGGDFEVQATTSLVVSPNSFVANSSKYAQATTKLGFSVSGYRGNTYTVIASTAFVLGAKPASTVAAVGKGPATYLLLASTGITLGASASPGAIRNYVVTASTSLNLASLADTIANRMLSASAASGIILGSSASESRDTSSAAATTITFGPSVWSGRDISVSAATALNLATAQGSNTFLYGAASSGFVYTVSAVSIVSATEVSSGFSIATRADASISLPAGGGVPGGAQSGLSTVLVPGVSGEFPFSFAETPGGLILVANGIDPMQRWDGLAGSADTAGVQPPATAIEFGGVGLGMITGPRVAYVRFIDIYGNVSNLSPVSNMVDFGSDGIITAISQGGQITSPRHGLSAGDSVIIEGVRGLPINGIWPITVIDADNFSIPYSTGSLRWLGGGRWVMGISTVLYGSVPTPTEPKVARRQILRNLDGNAETLYVDIDTTDLTSPAFTSTKTDPELAAGQALPLFTSTETPYANRYGVPPAHKAVIAAHLGRIFAAGDVAYTKGNCYPLLGTNSIQGVGTNWVPTMAGRMIYMAGATSSYEIASVDPVSQIITTIETVTDATGPFTSYSIRPAPGERKFVYYSEPALPEAWPPWNAISLPEDSDEITGLMIKGSFLYVLEKRHLYKFTFQSEPARDGFVFLTTRRGCVNNRCHVQVEDTAYLLDEIGLYAFDGQDAEPISTPIQTIFQQSSLGGLQVNWQADQRLWHAAHDPVKDTIRWFVAMTGSEFPRHAIAYDYRRKRFWIEEYPFVVTSSTVGTIGFRRSIAGSEARRVLCLGEGALDVVPDGNGLRGYVTSAGPLTLNDSSAPFPANLAGAPVSIAEGRGFGQQRKIVSNTSTQLKLDRPWLTTPDASSVYQIGGINWTWQSGWFRFADEQEDNSRDVELVFQPLRNQSSVSMRMYFDHHTEPKKWARTIDQDGVAVTDGQPEVVVDMTTRSGYAAHRLTGHRDPTAPGERFVSVEIAGVQARDPQRVYSVTVNGVRQP